jgi:hypothetical protein
MIRSLGKVTDWEKVSTGRRLLCGFGRVLVLFGVVTGIAFVLLVNQYSIEANVWHWRHGYSATIGGYEIPVPGHWLVVGENSVNLTLANLSPVRYQRDGEFHTTSIIDVDVSEENTVRAGWKESWVKNQRQ